MELLLRAGGIRTTGYVILGTVVMTLENTEGSQMEMSESQREDPTRQNLGLSNVLLAVGLCASLCHCQGLELGQTSSGLGSGSRGENRHQQPIQGGCCSESCERFMHFTLRNSRLLSNPDSGRDVES